MFQKHKDCKSDYSYLPFSYHLCILTSFVFLSQFIANTPITPLLQEPFPIHQILIQYSQAFHVSIHYSDLWEFTSKLISAVASSGYSLPFLQCQIFMLWCPSSWESTLLLPPPILTPIYPDLHILRHPQGKPPYSSVQNIYVQSAPLSSFNHILYLSTTCQKKLEFLIKIWLLSLSETPLQNVPHKF